MQTHSRRTFPKIIETAFLRVRSEASHSQKSRLPRIFGQSLNQFSNQPVSTEQSEAERSTYIPKQIEPKWQHIWEERGLYHASEGGGKPKFYCLDFFPYPSRDGLHVGHCRNYVPTDILLPEQGKDPEGEPPSEAYTGEGWLVNSNGFDRLPSLAAMQQIGAALEQRGKDKRTIQYRMHDWLISRQRPSASLAHLGCGSGTRAGGTGGCPGERQAA